jgi:hypothetical protein
MAVASSKTRARACAKADERGLTSFYVTLRGATVNLVRRLQPRPDHPCVLFEFF